MVRGAGLRAEDEGAGRRYLPLYAPGAGEGGRDVRVLREACQAYDLLGRSLLTQKTSLPRWGLVFLCSMHGRSAAV